MKSFMLNLVKSRLKVVSTIPVVIGGFDTPTNDRYNNRLKKDLFGRMHNIGISQSLPQEKQ